MLKQLGLISTEQQACQMSILLRFSSGPGVHTRTHIHTHFERVQLDESSSLLIAREGIIAYECVKENVIFPFELNVMFFNPRRKTC